MQVQWGVSRFTPRFACDFLPWRKISKTFPGVTAVSNETKRPEESNSEEAQSEATSKSKSKFALFFGINHCLIGWFF